MNEKEWLELTPDEREEDWLSFLDFVEINYPKITLQTAKDETPNSYARELFMKNRPYAIPFEKQIIRT
jgi:hypothetical protein